MDEFDQDSLKVLRFGVGSVVYLKSDIKQKCPMTVTQVITNDSYFDYSLRWLNSQKTLERDCFLDEALTPQLNNNTD